MDLPQLDAQEARVLGSLIEKDLTTPDYYPLSLNALVNACNQINNREPVMSLSETDVTRALDKLRDKRLAAVVSGGDNRVLKFVHKLAETLELRRPDLALLSVLLLRGPQTLGELRTRTARMHEFADLADAQTKLGELAARPEPHAPLVTLLPRQPGTKESRYAHLLSGQPPIAPAAATPGLANASGAGSLAEAYSAPLNSDTERLKQLEASVADLQRAIADLREKFAEFKKQFE